MPLTRRRRADELDRPIASALLLDEAHHDLISQSHERCASIGLSRIGAPDFSPLGRTDLQETLERNRRLFTHAAPVMEMLYEQIVNTQSMVVLTDSCGTIIHSIGDDDFLVKASKVALQPGVNWSESSKGTNGMGTALVNETPTLVHADEHFMHANHFLTCSAAPIFDPRGNILGVLDVTGDHRRYHQHTMGLVKMSARMIENHWLADDFRNVMRLHLHSRVEFLGTLMEGILAVSREGRIVGANRTALDHLGLSGAAVRMHSVTSLFGTTVGALVDHFRAPLAAPLHLSLPNGAHCHVRARFNWATWYGLGDPTGSPAAAPATAQRLDPPPAQGERDAPAAVPAPVLRQANNGLRFLETGDPQMQTVIGKVRKVVDRDIPILVLGETGTGKELLARAIHQDSERSRMPFVAVNCASIPETLIEAELFGYEDGAFTGARRKGAIGKILQANGGTLFLDEIGDMPLALQARLLRVLQERQVTPLGSGKSVSVDVAIIGATHRNLQDMIAAKAFREDLYYRLNGLVVKLPPLRERKDLLALVDLVFAQECTPPLPKLAPDVVELFVNYHWPGNLRQLSNVLRTAAVMASGESLITRDHLSDDFLDDCRRALAHRQPASATPHAAAHAGEEPIHVPPAMSGTLEEVEIEMIRRAVADAGGNISEASKRLGISRNTIYRKLRWNASGR
jgi:transcriptional regulator of acetoin/glycerol metabolism